ncbi:acyl-coenzyme A thioesterase 1 [Sardina pilchardus]|uniref:acyl-coenzyme A thioesterase 1 n=1 Tax=Sardina pilchardus TaxID=27697 RepID=UPI002E1110C4
MLNVLPGLRSSFDQPVHFKVTGLIPKQTVELHSKLTDDKGITFQARAIYSADIHGEIDLETCPSIGGSFTGTQAMGLFTSMKSDVLHHKLSKRDASTPVFVDVELISNGQVLGKETLERRFMADGVRKVPLENDKIACTIFLPPGPGPFPGVLDVYIYGGGMNELRASLLANKGFVVMALAYYGHKVLPKAPNTLDLEYFEKAVTLLRTHPKVKGPDIGILSISKGGDLALAMSAFLPGIAATVFINGCIANTQIPLHYKDMVIPPTKHDISKVVDTGYGFLDVRDVTVDPTIENKTSVIPIERASCHFMFVASEDDRNWNSGLFVEQAAQRLRDHGKENFEVIRYHKAGHFLEVPYMPHCPTAFHPLPGAVVAFGGEPHAHAEAQVDLWKRVPEFFKKHLNNDHSDFKAML